MEKIRAHINKYQITLGIVLTLILMTGLTYSVFSFRELSSQRITDMEMIREINDHRTDLLVKLRNDENIINSFQGEIKSIGTTVGNLKKLSETDDELLKKYSKVYFLNENYTPSHLSQIPNKYLFEPEREMYIHSNVWLFLQELIDNANNEGIKLLIASAYRSFDTQATLKSSYTVTYGAGTANQFSADQGYSEHQLGTTVDFTTPEIGANLSKLDSQEAFRWLQDNAYKYGFILSYPKDNSYYKYEPWHWRFVGKSLAKYIHNENKSFYDLDQRAIDNYLINIFDE